MSGQVLNGKQQLTPQRDFLNMFWKLIIRQLVQANHQEILRLIVFLPQEQLITKQINTLSIMKTFLILTVPITTFSSTQDHIVIGGLLKMTEGCVRAEFPGKSKQ